MVREKQLTNYEGTPQKATSQFFSRKFMGQTRLAQNIQNTKNKQKTLKTKNILPGKDIFQNKRNKSFPDRKAKETCHY